MSRNAQLFVTCIIDALYPEIGEAVVKVLQRTGVSLEFPTDQTCCGQPAFNAGMREEAMKMAEYTIQVFEECPGDIIIPSGSCTGMIKHGYQELFTGQPEWQERARNLAERSHELTEYLVDILQITDLDSNFQGKFSHESGDLS